MKKLTIIISTVIVVIALALGLIFIYRSYSLEGEAFDITNNKPVADTTISVDGKETKTDVNGKYKIEKLNKNIEVSVSQPNSFEPVDDFKVNFKSIIKSETITRDVKLTPTSSEMEARTWEAMKYGQYDFLWDLMHSDDQSYWGNKEGYVNALQNRDSSGGLAYVIKSYNIGGNTRILPKWKQELTGKEYENVSEVPFEVNYADNSIYNDLSHWINVNGMWRFFTTVNKNEL